MLGGDFVGGKSVLEMSQGHKGCRAKMAGLIEPKVVVAFHSAEKGHIGYRIGRGGWYLGG